MTFSVRNRLRPPYTWPSEVFGWLVIWKRSGTTQVSSLRARVIATYSSRRSSSMSSALPVANSFGKLPSTTFRM